jgi:hypothetical protein
MAGDDSYAGVKADLENGVQRSQWTAGGVVAVVALAAQLLDQGCRALAAVALTLALLAGALAAFARVDFAWSVSQLERHRERERERRDDPAPDWAFPHRAQFFMLLGVCLVGVAGIVLVVHIWVIAL